MKKKFLALITATVISAPAVFAFHEADTDHLASGMPVVFTATGLKFTPQQHSELRAIAQTWYSSECFMSSQLDMDVLVDQAGNGTVIMRWPTKESYVREGSNSPQRPMILPVGLNSLLEVYPLALVALQSETLNRKGFWGVVAPASSVVSKSHLAGVLVAQSNA